ncbi:glycoside hydrolase family 88 protein [Priestia megaterium]|uniref:glycoside hydrolase family 88 protein n=1 Tax=Priestia megaterium TaxID=1404 RepID=UPI0036DC3BDA
MNIIKEKDSTKDILTQLRRKMLQNSNKISTNFPHFTEGNRYSYRNDGFWTTGFWPALNLLAYQYYKDDLFLKTFQDCSNYLIKLLDREDILDHDIGFIYIPTFLGHYKLFGDAQSKEIALKAADMLKNRFNSKGKFIRAWNDWEDDTADFREEKKGKVIIDSLMNIPLLFWASQQTKNDDYFIVAKEHAETVMNYIVREDFSTYHTFNFDHVTGTPKKGKTQQGYADESCWSRGQAWGIYGFALVYQYTKEVKFLEMSMKLADYFIERLPEDSVPSWDFDAVENNNIKDSSAAAIAASGLLLVSELEESEKERYYLKALEIINSLCSEYLSCESDFEALLRKGCSDLPRGAGIESGIIYGDYFFLEALVKLNNVKSFFER